jgi:hypothetical protein
LDDSMGAGYAVTQCSKAIFGAALAASTADSTSSIVPRPVEIISGNPLEAARSR